MKYVLRQILLSSIAIKESQKLQTAEAVCETK
jgi:hypothetical protein